MHAVVRNEMKMLVSRIRPIRIIHAITFTYKKRYVFTSRPYQSSSSPRSMTMYKLKLLTTILFAVLAQRVACDDIPGGEICSCTIPPKLSITLLTV